MSVIKKKKNVFQKLEHVSRVEDTIGYAEVGYIHPQPTFYCKWIQEALLSLEHKSQTFLAG